MKNIESNRLKFRPFKIQDAKLVHTYLQDKEISDNTLTIPYPYREGMAEEWIAMHAEQRILAHNIFAIILKNENKLIGTIGIDVVNENQHGKLGYWIAKPYWNNGYGTEAIKRIIQYSFEDLMLHKVIGEHFDFNIASCRAMEKNGMTLEGKLRDHMIKNGKFVNVHLRAILKSEYSTIP